MNSAYFDKFALFMGFRHFQGARKEASIKLAN